MKTKPAGFDVGDRVKLRGREAYGILRSFSAILNGCQVEWEPGTTIAVRWSDKPMRPALWVGMSELEAAGPMTDRELIKAVTDHMHPWTRASVLGGKLQLAMPHWSEIEEAARRLIEGLEKVGYEIRRVPPESCGRPEA